MEVSESVMIGRRGDGGRMVESELKGRKFKKATL